MFPHFALRETTYSRFITTAPGGVCAIQEASRTYFSREIPRQDFTDDSQVCAYNGGSLLRGLSYLHGLDDVHLLPSLDPSGVEKDKKQQTQSWNIKVFAMEQGWWLGGDQ